MSRGITRGVAAGLALALGLVSQPVRAATTVATAAGPAAEEAHDPNVDRAMDAYARGTDNYNQAKYEEALADFTEAASLYASPDFQYNIGLCYEKLGKYEDAIRAFRTYLKAKPDAEDRPNVENRIAELEQELQRAKEAAETETEPEVQPEVTPPPDDPPEPTDDKAGRGLIYGGVALVAVGAAVAMGGGIGFGLAARSRSQAVDDVLNGGNPKRLSFQETSDLDEEGRRLEGIQIGMVAGGAVLAVTGSVLLALGLRKRKANVQTSAWLSPHGSGLALTTRF